MANSIANSFFWTSLTQGANIFFKFLSLILLSRLLSPQEYGLLAIIMIFIEVGYMIADSGMGSSLVKKKNCEHVDYDTLFIYNLTVGCLIYLILWAAAPFIASLYEMDVLVKLIRVASLQIIIHTLYAPQYIQIWKNLRFKTIAFATIIATSGGLIVALILAYNGYGVWALIAQFLAEAFIYLLYYGLENRYFPRMQFSKYSFKEQFTFGINLLGANLMNTVSNNLYNNVVAKIVNLKVAGFFVQASRIQNLPVSVINSVIDRALFPILSNTLSQKDFENVYFRVYGIFMMIVCFVSLILSVYANELVICVLGYKWCDAGAILRILAISIIPLSIQSVCRNALKSKGKTFAILKNQTIKTIILISTLILAFVLGFWAIVFGVVIAQVIVTILILFQTSSLIDLSFRKHFTICVPFIIYLLISLGVSSITTSSFSNEYLYLVLGARILSSTVVYVFLLGVFKNIYFMNVISHIGKWNILMR